MSDWSKETQIDTVLTLDRNYRNEAGIVEFCNRKFDCKMQYLGKAKDNRMPKELHYIHEIISVLKKKNIVVIVKDRMVYECLCQKVDTLRFEFIDTNTDEPTNSFIQCYTVFAVKGLEFSEVLVISQGMTKNQKIVACTRAMAELFYFDGALLENN